MEDLGWSISYIPGCVVCKYPVSGTQASSSFSREKTDRQSDIIGFSCSMLIGCSTWCARFPQSACPSFPGKSHPETVMPSAITFCIETTTDCRSSLCLISSSKIKRTFHFPCYFNRAHHTLQFILFTFLLTPPTLQINANEDIYSI